MAVEVTELYVAQDGAWVSVPIGGGGGGGGGGITRIISKITVSTTAGSAPGTDYAYICDGILTVTLPTAVGNTNCYTIKNIGTGIVTVAATGLETIDGSATFSVPTQWISINVISDNINWLVI
jgi:hypothetical protein